MFTGEGIGEVVGLICRPNVKTHTVLGCKRYIKLQKRCPWQAIAWEAKLFALPGSIRFSMNRYVGSRPLLALLHSSMIAHLV